MFSDIGPSKNSGDLAVISLIAAVVGFFTLLLLSGNKAKARSGVDEGIESLFPYLPHAISVITAVGALVLGMRGFLGSMFAGIWTILVILTFGLGRSLGNRVAKSVERTKSEAAVKRQPIEMIAAPRTAWKCRDCGRSNSPDMLRCECGGEWQADE